VSITYRLCFHKGGRDPEDKLPRTVQVLVSEMIKRWSSGPYSHVELQRGDGECFSADGYLNKVRRKEIRFTHPERWDFVDLGEFTDAEDEAIQEREDAMEGWKYDYFGAIFCPWQGLQVAMRGFCSEVDALALAWKPSNISPSKLFKVAKEWVVKRRMACEI
jgi:hypothetical protein